MIYFGICPRCHEEQFLSVPTIEWGMVCIYCLYELYPPNGIPRFPGIIEELPKVPEGEEEEQKQ